MSEPVETILAMLDVTKTYGTQAGEVHALAGVSLEVARGDYVAIMGPSGSGKSTLMHCLAGLDTVTAGEVWLGHTNLSELTDSGLTRMRRDRVGFIFQSFNLLGMLTARQNILLPFDLAGREPDWRWFDSVVEVLGLSSRLGHRPAELSGGEQQRVAVARALVTRPEVVFADEPTGNLDSQTGRQIIELLLEVNRSRQTTIVLVTHDPELAALADVTVALRDGRVARLVERGGGEPAAAAV